MSLGFLEVDRSDKYVRDGRTVFNLGQLIKAEWEYRRRDMDEDALYLVVYLTDGHRVSVPDGREAQTLWSRLQHRCNLGPPGLSD